MAILAGIDEAGFGPVLGPMVVSASVFSLPDEAADECLWSLLAGAVVRKGFRRSPALPVADSKTLYVRGRSGKTAVGQGKDLVHLERGVLGMLAQTGPAPDSLKELLRRTAPAALKQMLAYPWYAQADAAVPSGGSGAQVPMPLDSLDGATVALPRQAGRKDLALRANGLAEAMNRRGIVLEAVRAEPVFTGRYNRMVSATRNKATTLLGVTSRLMAYVFHAYAARDANTARPAPTPIRIVVDRQGGRMRYLVPLQRTFEGARIKIIEESDRCSAYLVRDGQRCAEIRFHTGGEDESLPVALASMVSKYIRELFMELLNGWWAARVVGLKPTAGYYVDGRRFLKDIDQAISAERIDRSLLVRSR